MLVDDRRTHTDHIGVRQQPCFAILCLPYASSGCIFHFEYFFYFCGPNCFLWGLQKSKEERQTVFSIYFFPPEIGVHTSSDRSENGGND